MTAERRVGMKSAASHKCLKRLVGAQGLQRSNDFHELDFPIAQNQLKSPDCKQTTIRNFSRPKNHNDIVERLARELRRSRVREPAIDQAAFAFRLILDSAHDR
jgi:hypothetical protein